MELSEIRQVQEIKGWPGAVNSNLDIGWVLINTNKTQQRDDDGLVQKVMNYVIGSTEPSA